MPVSWHSFDLVSGRRGPRLRTRTLGTISRIIGTHTDTSIEVLNHDGLAPVVDFEASTQPGRVLLVPIDDDTDQIIGGYSALVTTRPNSPGQWTTLTLATPEAYLDRRYTGTYTATNRDQASIAADLVGRANVDGINLSLDLPATGITRDRTWADDEDKTILSALQDLLDVIDGLEWTIDARWADATHTRVQLVFVGRVRLGSSLPNPTRWDLPGCLIDAEVLEDCTTEEFANDVMATSSGEGDVRPTSAHYVDTQAIAGGWPKYERRFTPSTSITDAATLNAHAAAEYDTVRDGLTQISLSAHYDAAPRLSEDWWLGDDITVAITSPRWPARRMPDGSLQPGYEHRVRVVGWALDLTARVLTPNAREVEGA